MTFSLKRLLRERREHARFKALPDEFKSIVIYNENEGYRSHLAPILTHLTEKLDRQVCYVTSSETDPLLAESNPNIRSFYIGEGIVRTSFFLGLRANVMVMTMPDLETFHIKRSKDAPVHYVYVFHSIVSTHMIYRERAFDNFDTILTVGPHHEAEIRATEEAYGLKPKTLVPHGSGRLDTVIAENRDRPPPSTPSDCEKLRVLVAPSWGPNGIIESRGAELARILVQSGYEVTFRPHPMTVKKSPESIDALRKFECHSGFRLETDVSGQESMHSSHVMISDWSGVAYEFAFGLERPVIFVDVPRKVNNPAYNRIKPVPLEVSIREKIGEVVSADELASINRVIDRVCSDPIGFQERIRLTRGSAVYNIGQSGCCGAETINAIVGQANEDVA